MFSLFLFSFFFLFYFHERQCQGNVDLKVDCHIDDLASCRRRAAQPMQLGGVRVAMRER